MDWTSLEEDAYLHPGKSCAQAMVITVTSVPDADMAGINVLLAE